MVDNNDSDISFITGFLIGAVMGIAIGFLYAPRPGKETRELLMEKAEKAREKVREAAERAAEAPIKEP